MTEETADWDEKTKNFVKKANLLSGTLTEYECELSLTRVALCTVEAKNEADAIKKAEDMYYENPNQFKNNSSLDELEDVYVYKAGTGA